jgi:hypothetical protein
MVGCIVHKQNYRFVGLNWAPQLAMLREYYVNFVPGVYYGTGPAVGASVLSLAAHAKP